MPLFQAHDAEQETLVSLRLLAQSVAAETPTAAVVAQIRKRLETGSSEAVAVDV